MKAELRLLAAALLMIVLVVASCQNRSIAQEMKPMEGATSISSSAT